MTAFNKKPSETYLQTVSALQKLMDEEGGDSVRRACADITWEDNKQIFAEREELKESGSPSLERLIGKRSSKSSSMSLGMMQLPADDHSSLWLKNGKPHTYVSQPYGLCLEDVKKLVSFCDEHNVDLSIAAWPSWHFPGRTLTVEVTKKAPKSLTNGVG